MSVREHSTKQGRYIIDCRPDGYKGKRQRIEISGTKEEALKFEREVMRRHIDVPRAQALNMNAIFPVWMSYYRSNRAESTVRDVLSCWRNVLNPIFGKLQPKALSRLLVEQYKTIRIETGVTHRTINKELSYLSAMLKWSAENDFCDPLPFPITGFSRKFTAPPKPRPLTPEQVTKVLEVIEPEYRLVYLLMADAGLRITEALTLKRSNLEFDHGIIFVVGKGNKERIVPITTDRLMAELEKRKDADGWLSVNPKTKLPYTSIKKALVRAAKKAGIEKHLYHHLLRHSFGTNATMANYDLSALQSIMGHSSVTTTGMYQHLAGEYLRKQGRKLNDMNKKESM
jgi:site-specific recombinase XerD